MLKLFLTFFFVFLFFTIPGTINAQNSLTHDTGPVQMTVYDDGSIGDFYFNGNVNAMFSAGLIGGNLSLGGAFGSVGSFTIEIQDFANLNPFAGFSSDPSFNQISSADITTTILPGADGHIEYKSNTGQSFIFLRSVITNNVGFDMVNVFFGIFADWDVGGANYILSRGGYDLPRNMLYQYENGGVGDSNYYGILLVNLPPNTVLGTIDKDIAFSTIGELRMDIFDLMTSTTFVPITVNGDYRTYMSSGPYSIAMGQTLALDYVFVAGTSLADLQANADAAILYALILPVELTSFTANVNNTGNVSLNWSTATEVNNHMFEIERKIQNGQYSTIGYVEGYGTTTEPKEYSYIDNTVGTGTYFYRLKQIDFGGQYEYSDEIEIEVNGPLTFGLQQNYPNPFNPSTVISFSVPVTAPVTLKIYDVLGNEVATIVNEEKPAGSYEANFIASNLSSGIYFYTMRAGNFVETKKMVLLK